MLTRMKYIKIWLAPLVVVMMAAFLYSCSTAHQATGVRPDSFTFEVQTVNPMGGNARQITGDYTLKFSKARVQADLPYFGRAYSAPINTTDGGIRLNTTEFEYDLREKRKGWEIVIRPANQRDVQMMVLLVSENGYGTLQVTSTNRQAISYYGRVKRNDLVNN